MNDLSLGQIVHSKAGRDKDKIFIVVGIIDKNYVLVADGDLRKINNPKKKKLMHLYIHGKIDEDIKTSLINNEKINDAFLRKRLKDLDC